MREPHSIKQSKRKRHRLSLIGCFGSLECGDKKNPVAMTGFDCTPWRPEPPYAQVLRAAAMDSEATTEPPAACKRTPVAIKAPTGATGPPPNPCAFACHLGGNGRLSVDRGSVPCGL